MLNLQELTDRLTDGARVAGSEAAAYAERIIATIESVRDAVQSDEFDERRTIIRERIDNPGGGAIPVTELLTVPLGSECVVDFLTVFATGGRATMRLTVNGADTVSIDANLEATTGGNGLVLPGGSTVGIWTPGVVAARTAVDIAMHIRYRTPRPARPAPAAGRRETRPEIRAGSTPDPETGRHGPWAA